ncbi:hypothetical protein B0H17DRAFT_1146842 [Mycena rosella]|uniref:Uncharacterized protein n=1 Tax=Mycena rosella TaxID=1033263 RepID=A0AAD7CMY1_MYCRO|nr:hypothetical protein B0H17DRAFT_1146842 [Mycena rosella]
MSVIPTLAPSHVIWPAFHRRRTGLTLASDNAPREHAGPSPSSPRPSAPLRYGYKNGALDGAPGYAEWHPESWARAEWPTVYYDGDVYVRTELGEQENFDTGGRVAAVPNAKISIRQGSGGLKCRSERIEYENLTRSLRWIALNQPALAIRAETMLVIWTPHHNSHPCPPVNYTKLGHLGEKQDNYNVRQRD